MKIVYMSRKGDEPKLVSLQEGKDIVAQEIDNGKLVVNMTRPDEKTIVTRATMGQLKEESTVGVFNPVAGG